LERRTVMAKAPPDDSPANDNSEDSAGLTRRCVIRLTDSALRYAERHQIKSEIERPGLGPGSLVGDLVSLETGERPHDFIIMGRRWVIASDGKRLELTLDHPARKGRP
jgi:hypothetical protein